MKLPIHSSNPIIREELLSLFEKEQQISLPAEYRIFLLTYNGGIPHLKGFIRVVDSDFEQDTYLEKLFTFERMSKLFVSLQNDSYFREALPNARLIPIGETIGQTVICLASSTDPALNGKIYVWDWDFGATYQAESLEEFLGQLRVFEEV
jgi:SMI1-KNR4 cell-wall